MDCLYVCVYKGENESYLQVKITLKHKGMYELTNYFLKPSGCAVLLLCCELVDQGCAPSTLQSPATSQF